MIVGPDRKSQEERRILTSVPQRRPAPTQNVVALALLAIVFSLIALVLAILVFNLY